jgi:hypothetical protein
MKLFNRILIIFLLLLLAAASTAMMIAPQLMISFLADAFTSMSQSIGEGSIVPMVGISALTLIVCLVLLWLELRWSGSSKMVEVQQVSGGRVAISADSIASRLKHDVDRLPGVIEVKPRVRRKRDRLDVTLDLTTGPEVDIPQKTEEVCQLVRQIVETQMGMKLVGDPQVRVRFGPFLASEDSGTPTLEDQVSQALPIAQPPLEVPFEGNQEDDGPKDPSEW